MGMKGKFNGLIYKAIAAGTVFISVFVATSCNNSHLFDFTKSTGDNIRVSRPVDGNFTKILLNNDVNLVITQGSQYSIQLEGGENLLPGIETSISDSLLTISNKNTYNWVRSYDKEITAYVTLPQILDIKYNATSRLSNTDTIREDSLMVSAIGGSGYIDLTIKVGTTKIFNLSGSTDMKIGGISGVSHVYSGGYGPIRCEALKSAYIFIKNTSSNDCYINVWYLLEYNITGIGNIYYKGNPSNLSGIATGSGKLIHQD